jgi:hypothetical protein
MACILRLTNTRTGRVSYGCAKTVQWLLDKPLPSIDEVQTFEEAVQRPFLDESLAVTLAEALTGQRPYRYQVLHPALR